LAEQQNSRLAQRRALLFFAGLNHRTDVENRGHTSVFITEGGKRGVEPDILSAASFKPGHNAGGILEADRIASFPHTVELGPQTAGNQIVSAFR
jgi:hypothetical protein